MNRRYVLLLLILNCSLIFYTFRAVSRLESLSKGAREEGTPLHRGLRPEQQEQRQKQQQQQEKSNAEHQAPQAQLGVAGGDDGAAAGDGGGQEAEGSTSRGSGQLLPPVTANRAARQELMNGSGSGDKAMSDATAALEASLRRAVDKQQRRAREGRLRGTAGGRQPLTPKRAQSPPGWQPRGSTAAAAGPLPDHGTDGPLTTHFLVSQQRKYHVQHDASGTSAHHAARGPCSGAVTPADGPSIWHSVIAQQLMHLRQRDDPASPARLEECETSVVSGARVVIADSKLYYRQICKMEAYLKECKSRTQSMLQVLTRAVQQGALPNVEFLMNVEDMPVNNKRGKMGACPIFSYDVNPLFHYDIALPFWGVLGDKIPFDDVPWEQRNRTHAFWRGSTTGGIYTARNWNLLPRSRLVAACAEPKSHCDARFTGFPQCHPDAQEKLQAAYGVAEQVPEGSLSRYRYLIHIDGNGAAASRTLKLLHSRSLLLWVESHFKEFFYPLLQPYVHYIPVSADLSDVLSKITFVRANEDMVAGIAANLYDFASRHLSTESVNAYVCELLVAYAELQQHAPSTNGMRTL